MDEILKYVAAENKEWVSQLNPENIAQIFNSLSMIPNMKVKYTELICPEPASELPANVGKAGELTFENIISQFMPGDYKLEDTAKQGYKGDFILKWQSYKTNQVYKIIIDVKNYKTTIPQKELDKFYRDLKLNSNIHGGLLLSLNARIVGVSKIIDFRELNTDKGNIPITFIKSSMPEIICEVIKLLFHTIENKDLNSNEIIHKDELISTINELSDQIQLITDCRNNLQNSKHELERNLNDIMFNLMQCEYNLASKIKQINKSLTNDIHIAVNSDITDEKKEEIKETDGEIKETSLNIIIRTFKDSIELTYESLLNTIFNIGWDTNVINIPKKNWILYKRALTVTIKFNKKSMVIIFPQSELCLQKLKLDKPKKYILNASGYQITINPNNINLIVELCKIFKVV
jgi:hypothetical protein